MDSNSVRWSALPKELVSMIANRIDTHIDILHLRAVCIPWRSYLPPYLNNYPPLPITLPFPIGPNPNLNPKRRGHFTLMQRPIYHLKPRDDNTNNTSMSSTNGWLIRVENAASKKLRLIDPLSRLVKVKRLPKGSPKVLNLFNFHVSEVSKAYGLEYVLGNEPAIDFDELKSVAITKVAISSSPASDDCVVMAIHSGGKLGFLKLGEKKWTTIDDAQTRSYYKKSHYNDIVYHKGQFYAVSTAGRIIVIDSSSKVTEFPSPVGVQYDGQFKHLVESFGDLFLLIRYLDVEEEFFCGRLNSEDSEDFEEWDFGYLYGGNPEYPVRFEVFKLNDEKKQWVRVKSLDGRAFFVGDDCSFSLWARELSGCKENCIYFSESFFSGDDDDHPGYDAGILDLADGTVGPLSSFPGYSHIFWPPPTWLMRTESSSKC